MRAIQQFLSMVLLAVLAACGGGGGGSNTQTPPPFVPSATLQTNKYQVYKAGVDTSYTGTVTTSSAQVRSGPAHLQTPAAASSANATLSINDGPAGVPTTISLSSTSGKVNSLSSTSHKLTTRHYGSVFMACDKADAPDAQTVRYIGVANTASHADLQLQAVTTPTEVKGLRFHRVQKCSYLDRNNALEKQDQGEGLDTAGVAVQNDGSLVSNHTNKDSFTRSAAMMAKAFTGAANSMGNGQTEYLHFFKYKEDGVSKYVGIRRVIDGANSYMELLLPAEADLSSDRFAQQCSANNPYQSDASTQTKAGTLTTEKQWIRAFMAESYLWYKEIPVVNMALAAYSKEGNATEYENSIDGYFEALKTPTKTASGKSTDNYHFTVPTKVWNDSSQGESVGYGMELTYIKSSPPRDIRIASVEEDSPAGLAGLQRGDVLKSINGVDAVSANSDADIQFLNDTISPKAGTSYSFVFARGGDTLSAKTLAATTVTKNPVPTSKVLTEGESKVGYLVFNSFLILSAEQKLITEIQRFKNAGVSDLVLDLRYNGGGYLGMASELAYMIGGSHTDKKVFEQFHYNDQIGSGTPDYFREVSCLPDANSRCTSILPLPTLNLSRVYVLTTARTCSASESVINGLRGAGVKVHLIGNTTCGKPYGYSGTDNCGMTYLSIQFKGSNHVGYGDYADGLGADKPAPNGSGTTSKLCVVADDFSHQLGDPAEALLAGALSLRASGDRTCPAVPTALASPAALRTDDADTVPRIILRPWYREIAIRQNLRDR